MKTRQNVSLKKYFIVMAFVALSSIFVNAQSLSRQSFWEQVSFGGTVGLSFGDGFFSGTLAPNAIYNVNDRLGLGLGINATYNRLKNKYKSVILGGSALGVYNPTESIQLSSEFEQLHVNRTFSDPQIQDSAYWVPALYVGAGYRANNFVLGVRYDLLYDDAKSIYANAWMPFVRFYF